MLSGSSRLLVGGHFRQRVQIRFLIFFSGLGVCMSLRVVSDERDKVVVFLNNICIEIGPGVAEI